MQTCHDGVVGKTQIGQLLALAKKFHFGLTTLSASTSKSAHWLGDHSSDFILLVFDLEI